MKREILNYLGEKIGELELPDETIDEVWEEELAKYAIPPKSQLEQMSEALTRAVSTSRVLADQIIEEIKKENLQFFLTSGMSQDLAIMLSLHTHSRMRAIDIKVGGMPFTIDLMNLIISGDLETAWVVLSYMNPDDMSMPFHYFSREAIENIKLKISARVSI